jgi:hypothetical protein
MDNELHKTVRAEDDNHARVMAVALMTCTHREGKGHRLYYMPGIGVKMTKSGLDCLVSRGVI